MLYLFIFSFTSNKRVVLVGFVLTIMNVNKKEEKKLLDSQALHMCSSTLSISCVSKPCDSVALLRRSEEIAKINSEICNIIIIIIIINSSIDQNTGDLTWKREGIGLMILSVLSCSDRHSPVCLTLRVEEEEVFILSVFFEPSFQTRMARATNMEAEDGGHDVGILVPDVFVADPLFQSRSYPRDVFLLPAPRLTHPARQARPSRAVTRVAVLASPWLRTPLHTGSSSRLCSSSASSPALMDATYDMTTIALGWRCPICGRVEMEKLAWDREREEQRWAYKERQRILLAEQQQLQQLGKTTQEQRSWDWASKTTTPSGAEDVGVLSTEGTQRRLRATGPLPLQPRRPPPLTEREQTKKRIRERVIAVPPVCSNCYLCPRCSGAAISAADLSTAKAAGGGVGSTRHSLCGLRVRFAADHHRLYCVCPYCQWCTGGGEGGGEEPRQESAAPHRPVSRRSSSSSSHFSDLLDQPSSAFLTLDALSTYLQSLSMARFLQSSFPWWSGRVALQAALEPLLAFLVEDTVRTMKMTSSERRYVARRGPSARHGGGGAGSRQADPAASSIAEQLAAALKISSGSVAYLRSWKAWDHTEASSDRLAAIAENGAAELLAVQGSSQPPSIMDQPIGPLLAKVFRTFTARDEEDTLCRAAWDIYLELSRLRRQEQRTLGVEDGLRRGPQQETERLTLPEEQGEGSPAAARPDPKEASQRWNEGQLGWWMNLLGSQHPAVVLEKIREYLIARRAAQEQHARRGVRASVVERPGSRLTVPSESSESLSVVGLPAYCAAVQAKGFAKALRQAISVRQTPPQQQQEPSSQCAALTTELCLYGATQALFIGSHLARTAQEMGQEEVAERECAPTAAVAAVKPKAALYGKLLTTHPLQSVARLATPAAGSGPYRPQGDTIACANADEEHNGKVESSCLSGGKSPLCAYGLQPAPKQLLTATLCTLRGSLAMVSPRSSHNDRRPAAEAENSASCTSSSTLLPRVGSFLLLDSGNDADIAAVKQYWLSKRAQEEQQQQSSGGEGDLVSRLAALLRSSGKEEGSPSSGAAHGGGGGGGLETNSPPPLAAERGEESRKSTTMVYPHSSSTIPKLLFAGGVSAASRLPFVEARVERRTSRNSSVSQRPSGSFSTEKRKNGEEEEEEELVRIAFTNLTVYDMFIASVELVHVVDHRGADMHGASVGVFQPAAALHPGTEIGRADSCYSLVGQSAAAQQLVHVKEEKATAPGPRTSDTVPIRLLPRGAPPAPGDTEEEWEENDNNARGATDCLVWSVIRRQPQQREPRCTPDGSVPLRSSPNWIGLRVRARVALPCELITNMEESHAHMSLSPPSQCTEHAEEKHGVGEGPASATPHPHEGLIPALWPAASLWGDEEEEEEDAAAFGVVYHEVDYGEIKTCRGAAYCPALLRTSSTSYTYIYINIYMFGGRRPSRSGSHLLDHFFPIEDVDSGSDSSGEEKAMARPQRSAHALQEAFEASSSSSSSVHLVEEDVSDAEGKAQVPDTQAVAGNSYLGECYPRYSVHCSSDHRRPQGVPAATDPTRRGHRRVHFEDGSPSHVEHRDMGSNDTNEENEIELDDDDDPLSGISLLRRESGDAAPERSSMRRAFSLPTHWVQDAEREEADRRQRALQRRITDAERAPVAAMLEPRPAAVLNDMTCCEVRDILEPFFERRLALEKRFETLVKIKEDHHQEAGSEGPQQKQQREAPGVSSSASPSVKRFQRLVNISQIRHEPFHPLERYKGLTGQGGDGPSRLPEAEARECVDTLLEIYHPEDVLLPSSLIGGGVARAHQQRRPTTPNPEEEAEEGLSSAAVSSASLTQQQQQQQQALPVFRPHQLRGVRFLWQLLVDAPVGAVPSVGGILAHAMGLGKTGQVVVFLHMFFLHLSGGTAPRGGGGGALQQQQQQQQRRTSAPVRVLLLAPKSVQSSWEEEFEKWSPHFLPPHRIVPMRLPESSGGGNPIIRARLEVFDRWRQFGGVLLMNYEALVQLLRSVWARDRGSCSAARTTNQKKRQTNSSNDSKRARKRRRQNDSGDGVDSSVDDECSSSSGTSSIASVEERLLHDEDDSDDEGVQEAGSMSGGASNTSSKRNRSAGLFSLPDDAKARARITELVICDEGHRLKSEHLQVVSAIRYLHPLRRLLLTGTPLQNHLGEYWNMINFVVPHYFSRRRFQDFFSKPIESSSHTAATSYEVERARKRTFTLVRELSAFVQRVDRRPLQEELPPLHEVVLLAPLSYAQRSLYICFLEQILKEAGGNVSELGSFSFLPVVSFAGKIACHPHLVYQTYAPPPPQSAGQPVEQQSRTQGNRTSNAGDAEEGSDQLLSSSPLGAPVQYPSGYPRNNLYQLLSRPPPGYYSPEAMRTAAMLVQHHAAGGADSASGREATAAGGARAGAVVADNATLLDSWSLWEDAGRGRGPNLASSSPSSPTTTSHALIRFKASCVSDRRVLLQEGPKLSLALQLVAEAIRAGEKTLMFSLSTRLLDFMEELIQEANRVWTQAGATCVLVRPIRSCRIDGSCSNAKRDVALRLFDQDPSVNLFLLSTKAGGVGLTITAATRVILVDSSYNPADEHQAVGRAYRYGQTRPVFVYRLLTKDTLEHMLFEKKISKEWLFKTVVDVSTMRRDGLTGLHLKQIYALMDKQAKQLKREESAERKRMWRMQTSSGNLQEPPQDKPAVADSPPSQAQNDIPAALVSQDPFLSAVRHLIVSARCYQSFFELDEDGGYGDNEEAYYQQYRKQGHFRTIDDTNTNVVSPDEAQVERRRRERQAHAKRISLQGSDLLQAVNQLVAQHSNGSDPLFERLLHAMRVPVIPGSSPSLGAFQPSSPVVDGSVGDGQEERFLEAPVGGDMPQVIDTANRGDSGHSLLSLSEPQRGVATGYAPRRGRVYPEASSSSASRQEVVVVDDDDEEEEEEEARGGSYPPSEHAIVVSTPSSLAQLHNNAEAVLAGSAARATPVEEVPATPPVRSLVDPSVYRNVRVTPVVIVEEEGGTSRFNQYIIILIVRISYLLVGTFKMTIHEVNQVRKEKKIDEDTRKQLEQLYGPSRAQRSKVVLTRPPPKRYVCPRCQRSSTDARRVCGFCLAAEPGTLTSDANKNAGHSAPPPNARRVLLGNANTSAISPPASSLSRIVAAQGGGGGVLYVSHTQRCYRVVTVSDGYEGGYRHSAAGGAGAVPFTAAAHPAAGAPSFGAHYRGEDDDEPTDCEVAESPATKGGEELEQEEKADRGSPRYSDPSAIAHTSSRQAQYPVQLGGIAPEPAMDSSPGSVPHPASVPFSPFSASTSLGKASAAGSQVLARRNPNKADYTHFIAIPIGTLPEVRQHLESLVGCMQAMFVDPAGEASGTAPHQDFGTGTSTTGPITADLFNTVDRMHLTLLLLSLHTDEEVQFAKDLLRSFHLAWETEKKRLQADPSYAACFHDGLPCIRMGGLYIMPPRAYQDKLQREGSFQSDAENELPYAALQKGVDRSKANILFMGVADLASLVLVRHIQKVLKGVFAELLMQQSEGDAGDNRAVSSLIHMTVMNSKWRTTAAKRPFDARELLETFGGAQSELADGTFPVREAVLCRMSTSSSGKGGRQGRQGHPQNVSSMAVSSKEPHYCEASVKWLPGRARNDFCFSPRLLMNFVAQGSGEVSRFAFVVVVFSSRQMKKYTAVQTPSSGKMSHYIYLPIGSLVEVNPKMEALQMQMDTVCASYKLPVTVVDPKQQHITLALLKLKDDETGKKCLELFQTAWKVKTEELQKDPEDNLLFRDDCTCLRLQGLHVFPSYKFIKSITASLENLYTSQSPYSTYDRDEYVSEATIVYAALDKKSLKAIRWMQDTLASVLSRSGCTDFWMQPVPHVACVHLKNNTIKTFNAEPILKEMKDRAADRIKKNWVPYFSAVEERDVCGRIIWNAAELLREKKRRKKSILFTSLMISDERGCLITTTTTGEQKKKKNKLVDCGERRDVLSVTASLLYKKELDTPQSKQAIITTNNKQRIMNCYYKHCTYAVF
eukprot:gene7450-5248_t